MTVQKNNPGAMSNSDNRHRIHLNFLDGLRGLAALYVVLHHFLAWEASGLPRWAARAVSLFSFGHTAVGLFIILSGFSLMLPVAREGSLRGGWYGFLKRRALRILPPYYASLALSVTLIVAVRNHAWARSLPSGPADMTSSDLVSHLLLVHNLSPSWIHGFNMALWSVATEWQIYFLFPLLIIPIWKRWGSGVAVAAGFLAGLVPLAVTLVPGRLHGVDLSGPCFWYIGLFAIGAAGAVSFVRNKTPPVPRLLTWSILIAICYVSTLRLLPMHSTSPGGPAYYLIETLRDGLTGSLALCLIFCCSSSPCALRQLLETGPLRRLGAFSYSLYLTHCIVLQVVDGWAVAHDMSGLIFLNLKILAVPVALVFAYLFHLVFERPFLTTRNQQNVPVFSASPIVL